MRTYQLCIGLILITTLVAGCTSSKQFQVEEKKKPEQPKEKIIRLSEYEATLNPVDFDREIEVAQKTGREEQKQQANLEIPKDSMAVRKKLSRGFAFRFFHPLTWMKHHR